MAYGDHSTLVTSHSDGRVIFFCMVILNKFVLRIFEAA